MATITISVPVASEWPPSTGQPWPQCPVAACKWFSTVTGCSPASLPVRRATSKLPACNRDVEARTRAKTSESGPRESKWPGRPMPATSWPARVGRRGPHRTSDTSRQVLPQLRIKLTNTIQKSFRYQRWWCSGRTAVQYAWGPGFESSDFLCFANSHILSYTAYNAVYTFSIYVYTSISQYIPV